MTDRAVSEVVAFILVFSIVITSVGLLYTVGFGSIDQIQEVEQDRSAERAFQAVAVAFDDLQRDRGSNRQAGVDLAGRSLHVDEDEEVTVEVFDGGTPVNTETATGALVYGAGEDTEIAYLSGAVVRSQGPDAQVTSRPPRFRCADDHAVVSLVEVSDVRNGSISSGGTVDLVAERVDPDASRVVSSQTSGSPSVEISYSGEYDAAFNDSFVTYGDNWSPTGSGGYECTGIDEVHVRKTEIRIDYWNV